MGSFVGERWERVVMRWDGEERGSVWVTRVLALSRVLLGQNLGDNFGFGIRRLEFRGERAQGTFGSLV